LFFGAATADLLPPSGGLVGGQTDAHGCAIGGGYSWCDSLQQCTRPWLTPCPAPTPAMAMVGGQTDAHGCIIGAGYSWCDGLQQCVRPWMTPCPTSPAPGPIGGQTDAHGCIAGAGYSWCDALQQCIQPWMTPCPVANQRLPGGPMFVNPGPMITANPGGPMLGVNPGGPMMQAPASSSEAGGPVIGGNTDTKGCQRAAGYVWCQLLNQCVRPWETPCQAPIQPAGTVVGNSSASTQPLMGGQKDSHGCVTDGGYTWCAATQQCQRNWVTPCPGANATSANATAPTSGKGKAKKGKKGKKGKSGR